MRVFSIPQSFVFTRDGSKYSWLSYGHSSKWFLSVDPWKLLNALTTLVCQFHGGNMPHPHCHVCVDLGIKSVPINLAGWPSISILQLGPLALTWSPTLLQTGVFMSFKLPFTLKNINWCFSLWKFWQNYWMLIHFNN